MANNYLRYKYYLVTRDAFTQLFTAIKNIVAQGNLSAGITIYVSKSTGTDIQFTDLVRMSPDVCEMETAEINSTCEGFGKVIVEMFPATNAEIKSVSEGFGKVHTNLRDAVNTKMKSIINEFDIHVGAYVRPMLWKAGLNEAYQVVELIKAHLGIGLNRAFKTEIDFNTSFNAHTASIQTTKINSTSQNTFETSANCGVSVGDKINSISNLVGRLHLERANSARLEMLSTSDCIETMKVTMYNRNTLNDLASYTLVELDDMMLSELDYTQIN